MSPFDVLKKDFVEPKKTLTTRVRTSSGNVLVHFPPNWQKENGRTNIRETTKTSLEATALKFKLGDHQLPYDVVERLNTLPTRSFRR